MMPNWTKQQEQAIRARNHTILVSAAAGSGKTAVLVERIVSLVREGASMNRMLIVTFTKAAAAEMRQRLAKRISREAISREPAMVKAIDELETTQISTIHAFCQRVIRSHFEQVGVDPLVRVCDEQQQKLLFEAAFTTAMDELLDERTDENFLLLADAWKQDKLLSLTAQLYDFLMALPKPFAWLDEHVEQLSQPLMQQPWVETLENAAKLQVGAMDDALIAIRSLFDLPNAVMDRMEALNADAQLVSALQGLEGEPLRTAVANFSLPRLSPKRGLSAEEKEWGKRFSDGRTAIKKRAERANELLNPDFAQLERELPAIQAQLRGLAALVKRTHQHFREEKNARNCMDFGDMEQYTLDILEQPEVRAQMQGEFDHIFVDECQDVSQIQDAILQAIHGEQNCLFMVGDVKQSIYRFRKADPTLFLGRMQTYSEEETARERKIVLQQNFRSSFPVLDATNRVFRQTMRPAVTELTYAPEDELICGLGAREDDPPVMVHLLRGPDIRDALGVSASEAAQVLKAAGHKEVLRTETRVVAHRIKELLGTTMPDGKTISYRDMVILLAQTTNLAQTVVDALTEEGIPTFYDGAESYFNLPEIMDMKALLSLLDNAQQDFPLLTVLKMVPFSLTDEELAQIRLMQTGQNVPFYQAFAKACDGEDEFAQKCRKTSEKLETWRFQAEVMRLSDFIWHLMTDSGYYAAVGALPKGEVRQGNLRMLYERAQAFEAEGGVTLAAFITRMDEQERGGDSMSAKMLTENEDLVRVMTMHKSKGLEFPVVFLMNLEHSLLRAQTGTMLLHPKLGVALPYINRKLNICRRTLMQEAFEEQRRLDELAERARLLYVAMTRTKLHLELVATVAGDERTKWDLALPPSDSRVRGALSMIAWVMQAISTDAHTKSTNYPQASTPWDCRDWDELPQKTVDKVGETEADASKVLSLLQTAPPEDVFPEKTIQADILPLKTSVSTLVKKQADELPLSDAEEDAETKHAVDENGTPLLLSELPRRPAFMEEKRMTAAERGTLTHRALSLMPLDALRAADNIPTVIREALAAMQKRGLFTEEELHIISVSAISGYFTSKIGRRMLQSGNVRREWAFNLRLTGQQALLLQGVIDCAFEENGAWVLVDYKTDRMDDEQTLVNRYAEQLAWYARALAEITGKPVKERYLYALRVGKAIAVPEIDAK